MSARSFDAQGALPRPNYRLKGECRFDEKNQKVEVSWFRAWQGVQPLMGCLIALLTAVAGGSKTLTTGP